MGLTSAHRWCAALNGAEEIGRLGGAQLPAFWHPDVVVRRYAIGATVTREDDGMRVTFVDGSSAERVDAYWHVVRD